MWGAWTDPVHLMRWLTGTGEQPDRLDAILLKELEPLHAARVAEDQRIVQFVQSRHDSDFEEFLDYRSLGGEPKRQRLREILAHLFNHETHHRGQAHAILTRWGVVEPDSLDLFIMLREQSSGFHLVR